MHFDRFQKSNLNCGQDDRPLRGFQCFEELLVSLLNNIDRLLKAKNYRSSKFNYCIGGLARNIMSTRPKSWLQSLFRDINSDVNGGFVKSTVLFAGDPIVSGPDQTWNGQNGLLNRIINSEPKVKKQDMFKNFIFIFLLFAVYAKLPDMKDIF